jgi:hypothetical protein
VALAGGLILIALANDLKIQPLTIIAEVLYSVKAKRLIEVLSFLNNFVVLSCHLLIIEQIFNDEGDLLY